MRVILRACGWQVGPLKLLSDKDLSVADIENKRRHPHPARPPAHTPEITSPTHLNWITPQIEYNLENI